jgi:polar amino acid transport system substrate-binding protein
MRRFLIGILPLVILFLTRPALAEPVKLGTLEWPPFSSPELPGQGQVCERVRSICAEAGMRLELSFTPWKRVLLEASSGVTQGFFPEYHSVARERDYYFSQPVGCSVVGLVRRSDATLSWGRLEDLAAYRIGVVDGYVNTGEFDRLAESGVLQTVKSNSDLLALRMLKAGRVDAVVMDRAVFKHLSSRDDSFEGGVRLEFDRNVLAVHSLHACFPRTAAGRGLLERFDEAIVSGGFSLKCLSEFEAAP